MKDKKEKFNSRFIKLSKLLVKGIGYLFSVVFLLGLIYALYWFSKSFYENFFIAQSQPFSLSLSKFQAITVAGKIDCLMGDGPVDIYINRPLNELINQEMSFESEENIDFHLVFPTGTLSAMGFNPNNDVHKIDFKKGDIVTVDGSAAQLKVEYLQVDYMVMSQSFCATEVGVLPYPSALFYPGNTNYPKTIWTEQNLSPQNRIKVTLLYPKISNRIDTEEFERIELSFIANGDIPKFIVGISGSDFRALVPEIVNDFGKYPAEMIIIRSKQFEIQHPVGTLKFGNSAPIILDEITSKSDDTLVIRDYGLYYISSSLRSVNSDKFEVSGTADNIILNNEEKIKQPWFDLPEYVQAGLFTLLVSLVGGLLSLRQSIGKGLVILFPFLKPKFNLPKESFVIVMNSGFIIAGELSRKPAKNYPYYLLKKARRKPSLSGDWEKEIISEIKIRADAVDQSYVT